MMDIIKTEGWNVIFVEINVGRRCDRRGNFEIKINEGLIKFFCSKFALFPKSDGERNCFCLIKIDKFGDGFTLTIDGGIVDGDDICANDVGFGSLGSEKRSSITSRDDILNKDTMVKVIGIENKTKAVGTGRWLI